MDIRNVFNISAKVRGDANVRWTERLRTRDSEGSPIHVPVTYSGHENYLTTTLYLAGGPSQEFKLPPGEHVYNFSVILPENLPSSFEGKHGNIRYMVRAKVNRVWAFDHTVRTFFTVLSHIDLNKDPLVKEPVTNVAEKTLFCCCCRSGLLTLVGHVPAVGFVSGQEIPVTVEVDNATNEIITSVSCSLQKNVYFTAHSPRKRTIKTSYKVETITFERVGEYDSKTWTKHLKIPSLPTSTLKTCSIINVKYCLDIKAVAGLPYRNLRVNIPIILGTIPLLTYVPRGFMNPVTNPTIQIPQLPALQSTSGKFPQSPTVSAPYPPPSQPPAAPYPPASQPSTAPYPLPSQLPTPPYPTNTTADTTSGTDHIGFSNPLLPMPSQPNQTPSAPRLPYPDIPPPSHEECMFGASNVNIGDNASHIEE